MIVAPFPTCEECTLRLQGGGEFRVLFVGTEKPAEPPEERFEGLLRTRVFSSRSAPMKLRRFLHSLSRD